MLAQAPFNKIHTEKIKLFFTLLSLLHRCHFIPIRNRNSMLNLNIKNCIITACEYTKINVRRQSKNEEIKFNERNYPIGLRRVSNAFADLPRAQAKNLCSGKDTTYKPSPRYYKASRVIDALVKTESTKGASCSGCIVVGTMVYPFGSGSKTISQDISRELT